MTERLIKLYGHQFDLEQLSEHFTSDELNVRRDENGYYYLRSSDFEQMSAPDAFEKRGRELVEYINGAAKLLFGSGYRSIEFDAAARIEEDGQRFHTVGASVIISGRSRVSIDATLIRADGTVEGDAPRRLDDAEALVSLADRDDRVADALRFYERGDWINLYKAWEVVCDAAGSLHQVVKNGWATESDRSRFTQTAQSRAELGDEARHASETYKAPKNPMNLEEAQAFVRFVIQAWIRTL
jgi:hypothetical protein